jgi:hypothetical protein
VKLARLLATLLLLPLLLGGGNPASSRLAPAHAGDVSTSGIVAALGALTVEPALPGAPATHALADAGLAAPRTPGRPHDFALERTHSADAQRTRASLLDRAWLDYSRAISYAHTCTPSTCGNPPPSSPA